MIRPVPGHELLRFAPCNPAKAHERFHFVNVPMHGLLEQIQLPYIVVHPDFQKVMLAVRDAV